MSSALRPRCRWSAATVTHMTAGAHAARGARGARPAHRRWWRLRSRCRRRSSRRLEADDIDALPDAVFAAGAGMPASAARCRIDPQPGAGRAAGAAAPGWPDADRTIELRSLSARQRRARGRAGAASGLPSRACCWPWWWSAPARRGACCSGCRSRPSTRLERRVVVDAHDAAAAKPKRPAVPTASAGDRSAGTPWSTARRLDGAAVPRRLPPPCPAAGRCRAAPARRTTVMSRRAATTSWITRDRGRRQAVAAPHASRPAKPSALPAHAAAVGDRAGKRLGTVDVQVRGKPFDLTPLARAGGVARFEVKP